MPNGMPMTKTELSLTIPEGKKAYFTSDWHLGYPDRQRSFRREKIILSWLDRIEKDAEALFLVGDIFDFWFDYKHAVPRNPVRILGKLAAMADKGTGIYYFFGNHDMWFRDYFEKEIGMKLIPGVAVVQLNGSKIFVAHGDGLGPGDVRYKLLKKIFRNPLAKMAYRWLHPDLGIPLASFFSRLSRNHTPEHVSDFLGEDKEHLIIYSKEVLNHSHFDYFIFGHRHHAVVHPLSAQSTYINLGDWIRLFTYAVYDSSGIRLEKFASVSNE